MLRLSRIIVPWAGRCLPRTACSSTTPQYQQSWAGGVGRRHNSDSSNTSEKRREAPTSDRSEPSTFSEEFDRRIPSNKARPTLSDAYQHSGADPKHPRRPSVEEMSPEEAEEVQQSKEDVKKHNEEVERRYDRAFSQVIDEKGNIGALKEEVDEKGNVKGE